MSYYLLLPDIGFSDRAVIEGHPAAVLSAIEDYEFADAESLTERFPERPRYELDLEYPNRQFITDYVENTDGLLVLSEKFINIVKQFEQGHMELLPIDIVGEQGDVVSERHCIVNLLGTCSCMDWEQSDYTMSPFVSGNISALKKLVLKEENVPTELVLFRLDKKPTLYLIHKALKEALVSAGVTGCRALPVAEYQGYSH